MSKPWTKEEIRDQFLHTVLGAVTSFPVIGGLFSILSREYYQAKIEILDVAREHGRENVVKFKSVIEFMWVDGAFWKRDLLFGYAGVAMVGIPFLYFVVF